MLHDELYEQLKTIEPDLNVIRDYWNNMGYSKRLETLITTSKEENFWQNPLQGTISKELQKLRADQEIYNSIMNRVQENSELVSLFAGDEKALQGIAPEINQLIRDVKSFKLTLLLNSEQDNSNCFLSINAGA